MLYRKDNDNRPYVDIIIFGKTFSCLIDTGSNLSVLGSLGLEFLKNLSIPISITEQFQVSTADGTYHDVGGFVETYVTVDKLSRILKLYLLPSVTQTVILGMDFLKTFNIKIDFSKFTMNLNALSLNVINTVKDVTTLTNDEKIKLDIVIEKFKSISPKDKIGRTHILEHFIDTGNSPPFKIKQYPLPQAMEVHVNNEIDTLLKLGVIEPSTSPYCSPICLTHKPDGSIRLLLDARFLNKQTKADSYMIPNIEVILSQLRDTRYISSIDLKHAFYQIPLEKSSRPKTAFAIRSRGLFQFTSTPFGLISSPATMSRLMDMVIGPSLEPYCFYYLDDIIVCTSQFDKHIEILSKVYEKLKEANLTVNIDKCHFCRPSLRYLGYTLDENGLSIDGEKTKAITNYPVPRTTTEVRRFLGVVSYYRRFLNNFSTLSAPISDLLSNRKKNQPISWTPEAQKAFDDIKTVLTTAPVLCSPDFNKSFYLMCDASDVGIGSVLFQLEDGLEHPVAYYSKKLNKCQKKYTTTEKEALAVLLSIDHFRYYLLGRHFTVITDHSSLVWLNNMKKPSPRLARWILQLSQYNFSIVHRRATGTVPADFLSRVPEINVLDLSLLKPDNWYKNMINKVQSDPDSYPNFKVENNILYKHVFNKYASICNLTDWKIVVPTENRLELLSKFHDDPTAAHFGVFKTLERISELYYWPKMRQSVQKYVRRCKVCAACKPINLPQAGLMGKYRNIEFPFQLISCDLIGPYPRSRQGNTCALVIVDFFSKFVLIQPLKQATSSAIVKFIENNVFLIFGVPQIVAVDNGKQFTSQLFKNLMSKYNVQSIWYTANYTPQANHTERVNKSIVTAIRSYCFSDHRTWDVELQKIAQAIRLSKHEVTEFPPSFLVFARNVPVSGSFFGNIAENANNQPAIADKIHRLQDTQEMPKIFEDVRKKLHKAYIKSSNRYNLRKRDIKFHVGDHVWKKNYQKSDKAQFISAKFMPKYIHCTVNRVISPLIYELKDSNGKNIGRWHIKDLKEYNLSTDESSDFTDDENNPDSVSSDSE